MSFEEEKEPQLKKKNKMENISSTDMLDRNYVGYLKGSWTPSLSLFHNIDWILPWECNANLRSETNRGG